MLEVSPKETKGSGSVHAYISNMCFPPQIICNCYSNVSDFVNALEMSTL